MTILFLSLYLAAMAAIGIASRKAASASEEAYYVADRSFGAWRGFVGLASTTTGGSATIVCAALVYRHGLPGIWLDLAGAAGLFALGLMLAGRVRRTGAMTLPEIAGRFYGDTARVASGCLVLVAEIAWFALLLEASQTVLTAAFGLDPVIALVSTAAVFIFYTSVGGQYAVVRTDLVQYALMVAGVVGIAAGYALVRTGPALPMLEFPVSATLGWREVAGWILLIGLPHLVGSDVYGKLLSCRDERAARRAAFGAAFSKVVFGGAVAFVALSLHQNGIAVPAEQALPRAILAYAPPAAAAFALVALVATMQSSADSVLLSAASVTVRDIAPAVLRWRPSIAAARLLVPIYGAFGLLVALRMRALVPTLQLGYSVFAAGMILPILFGFFPRLWVPPPAVVAAIVAGASVALFGHFVPRAVAGLDPVVAGLAVNLALLLLGIARRSVRRECPGDYLRLPEVPR
jgi:SSS family solute:Na+ symporter